MSDVGKFLARLFGRSASPAPHAAPRLGVDLLEGRTVPSAVTTEAPADSTDDASTASIQTTAADGTTEPTGPGGPSSAPPIPLPFRMIGQFPDAGRPPEMGRFPGAPPGGGPSDSFPNFPDRDGGAGRFPNFPGQMPGFRGRLPRTGQTGDDAASERPQLPTGGQGGPFSWAGQMGEGDRPFPPGRFPTFDGERPDFEGDFPTSAADFGELGRFPGFSGQFPGSPDQLPDSGQTDDSDDSVVPFPEPGDLPTLPFGGQFPDLSRLPDIGQLPDNGGHDGPFPGFPGGAGQFPPLPGGTGRLPSFPGQSDGDDRPQRPTTGGTTGQFPGAGQATGDGPSGQLPPALWGDASGGSWSEAVAPGGPFSGFLGQFPAFAGRLPTSGDDQTSEPPSGQFDLPQVWWSPS